MASLNVVWTWQPSLILLGSHHCFVPTESLPCPPSCPWPSKPDGRPAGLQSRCFQAAPSKNRDFLGPIFHTCKIKSSCRKAKPCPPFSFSVLPLIPLEQKKRMWQCPFTISGLLVKYSWKSGCGRERDGLTDKGL